MRSILPEIVKTAIFSLVLSFLGCRLKPGSGVDYAVKGAISEGSEYQWPNAKAEVCWENSDSPALAPYSEIRDKIASFVTSEYARANFNFYGWKKCGPNSRGIRVEQTIPPEPAYGSTSSFGKKIDGLFGGVTFFIALPDQYDNKEVRILGTALHEFGHAVGLRHEANRLDSPCSQDQTGGFGEEQTGMLPMGGYDAK